MSFFQDLSEILNTTIGLVGPTAAQTSMILQREAASFVHDISDILNTTIVLVGATAAQSSMILRRGT